MIFHSTNNSKFDKPATATLCLCMIVKNEGEVIQRCLASVKPLISHWVIVDTGSTDNTMAQIEKILSPISGHVIEKPWVDFAHNRNEAMQLARGKAEFILTIDADELLLLDENFKWPDFSADIYAIKTQLGPLVFARGYLMRSVLPWRYEGIIHERPVCSEATSIAWLDDATVLSLGDGGRSKISDRIEREVNDLQQALGSDSDNHRYRFLLANALANANQLEDAINTYQDCLRWDDTAYHRWYSIYQIGLLTERLGGENTEIINQYQSAFELDPTRAEPLYRLVRLHRLHKDFEIAKQLAEVALEIPKPRVFEPVDHELYDILLPAEYAICCQKLGEPAKAVDIYDSLLRVPGLSAQIKVMLENNRRLAAV